MPEVIIAEHALKHGLSAKDIEHAWEHYVAKQYRGAPNEGEIVAIGPCHNGNLIQIVALERSFGIIIYHAMEPPTDKVIDELGIPRRKK